MDPASLNQLFLAFVMLIPIVLIRQDRGGWHKVLAHPDYRRVRVAHGVPAGTQRRGDLRPAGFHDCGAHEQGDG